MSSNAHSSDEESEKHLNTVSPPRAPYNNDETETPTLTKYSPLSLHITVVRRKQKQHHVRYLHVQTMRKKTNALTTCLPPPLPATAMSNKKINEMSLNLHSSYEKEEKHLTQPNQAQPAQLRPGSQPAQAGCVGLKTRWSNTLHYGIIVEPVPAKKQSPQASQPSQPGSFPTQPTRD